jgi:hypothetical protein
MLPSVHPQLRHSRWIFILALLLLSWLPNLNSSAQSTTQKDTTQLPKAPVPKEATFTYLRLGIDISKFIASALEPSYSLFEMQADIHYKRDMFMVLEGGLGRSSVDNDYLQFTSTNGFVRLGIDKTFFTPEYKNDYDNAFLGVRYGASLIQRADATYQIADPVWGNSNGIIRAENNFVHWLELTAGFRLQVKKNIFAGWNVRGKTLINPKAIESLPPSYIAGYGRGDKNTAFGYNFYILYGIHTKRQQSAQVASPK